MKSLFIFLSLLALVKINAQAKIAPPKKICELTDLKKEVDSSIYNTSNIQVKPEFPEAGLESMYAFIRKNFVIPKEIIEGKQTKTVFVSFIVEKDGSLSDIKVLRDAGYDTGKEAIRVLKLMPKWLPGEHDGYHVRCIYSIPIRIYADQ